MNTERELAIDELRDEKLEQVVVGDISFTPRIDKASPILMPACCTGTHLKG
jgi:type VI protein secretion system component Hcp